MIECLKSALDTTKTISTYLPKSLQSTVSRLSSTIQTAVRMILLSLVRFALAAVAVGGFTRWLTSKPGQNVPTGRTVIDFSHPLMR